MTKTKIVILFIALYSFFTISMMSCTRPKIITSQEGSELNPLRVVYVQNIDGNNDKVIGELTSLGTACISYKTIRNKKELTVITCGGYTILIY